MKRTLEFSSAAVFLGVCALVSTLNAQPVNLDSPYGPPVDTGGPPEIIFHRPNPHFGAAPTAGGTSATSPISYHGGPVLATPTVYVIWYGNWNKANATDTPGGQQIVRDFLAAI